MYTNIKKPCVIKKLKFTSN